MKIKIPKGESCAGCLFIKPTVFHIFHCVLFSQLISDNYFKCPQCLNHEPVIVEYEGEKEDEQNI